MRVTPSLALLFAFGSSIVVSAVSVEELYFSGDLSRQDNATDHANLGFIFKKYKVHFNKSYFSAEEEAHAFGAFNATLKRLEANQNPSHGLTKFSDLYPEEFKKMYTGRKNVTERSTDHFVGMWKYDCLACKRFGEEWNLTERGSLDWTTKGAVTPVKDQGQCGSCWSFGTTGDIEGVHFLATGKLVSLSEQELVSCDDSGEDEGCNGGLQEDAFEFVIKQGGLVTEEEYPYTSGRGRTGRCDKSKEKQRIGASISGWSQVSDSAKGEDKILKALVASGPITIGINATPMQDYDSGIDNPRHCSGQMLDHAVLIVGYGTEDGVDYWKIKNSWNTDWGEDGYYRIVRGVNKCGLANDAVHSKS